MTLHAGDPQPTPTLFRQAHASVGLWSTSPTAASAARDTLYAYQVADGPESPNWQVIVAADGVTPPPLDPFETGGMVCDIGPRLTARRRGDTWWVPELASLIVLDRPGRTVTVRCPEHAAGHWAVRLTRQVMTGQLLTGGAAYAHAAAFLTNGRGVAIAGVKGRGKTTTLLAALQHLGADLVSNDRLLLRHDGTRVVGHAWPQRAHLGVGTLTAFPNLLDLAPAALRGLPGADLWGYPHKVVVEPPDFGRLLNGGAVTGSCPIDVLIWPHLVAGRRDAVVERVDAHEVRATLPATSMFMLDPGMGYSARINHWLGTSSTSDSTVPALAGHLADTVPCYRLHGGTDPAALAAALADLVTYTGALG